MLAGHGGDWNGQLGAGADSLGAAGEDWRGVSGTGADWIGWKRLAWQYSTRHGGEWRGWRGMARQTGRGGEGHGWRGTQERLKHFTGDTWMDEILRRSVRERLERIRTRNKGVLTPDDVIKDAKSESSPLHSFFTWDDTEASHQFRLEEARTLIRNVKVLVTTSTQRIAAPFYIRDPRVDTKSQGYGSLAEIKDEADVAADALEYEFDRAISSLERAVRIADALGMSKQVDDLLQRARGVRSQIATVTEKKPRSKTRPLNAKSVARTT